MISADNEDEDEDRKKHRILRSALIILAPICNLILFIFTQDMSLPMAIFDMWSLSFALILIAQVLLVVFMKNKNEVTQDDEVDEVDEVDEDEVALN